MGIRRRKTGQLLLLRDQHADLAVAQHVLQPLGRIIGIQREIRPTRFKNAQHAHDQIDRTFETEPDDDPRLDPSAA